MNAREQMQFDRRRQHSLFHARCVGLANLIHNEVHPLVAATPAPTVLDRTVFGLHLRAFAWAYSVKRLDDIFDHQAHGAACRALFEVVIDLVLLTHGGEPIDKLVEWERLSTFREAQRTAAAQQGDALVRQAAAGYVAANTAAVAAALTKYWPKRRKHGRDPMRWTGCSVIADAIRADAALPLHLGDFGRSDYTRLCWNTHGSGLILERAVSEDAFPGLSILALNGCSTMLGHAIRLVLEHFKLFDAAWGDRITDARNKGILEANRRAFDAIVRAGEASPADERGNEIDSV